MGWSFIEGITRKQIIAECIKSQGASKCIEKYTFGNEVWTVWENDKQRKYILLFVLKSHKNSWGYKCMDEVMHPYYYNCPIRFLDIVPIINQQWRDEVIARHKEQERRKALVKTLKPGDIVKLSAVKPDTYRITQVLPILVGKAPNGGSYRIPKTRVVSVLNRMEN